MRQNISAETMRLILKYQKAEITDCLVYKNLAKRTKDKKESDIIMRLSREEQGHLPSNPVYIQEQHIL